MAMKMNKKNYAEIMEDNIVFLNKYAPKCMTTSHIEDVLKRSIELEYPDQQGLEESKWQALKEFLYEEIIHRREYSASKSFEVVLEEMNRLFPNPKENAK